MQKKVGHIKVYAQIISTAVFFLLLVSVTKVINYFSYNILILARTEKDVSSDLSLVLLCKFLRCTSALNLGIICSVKVISVNIARNRMFQSCPFGPVAISIMQWGSLLSFPLGILKIKYQFCFNSIDFFFWT